MGDEQILKLNPETGYYEGTFTIRVEAEIFRRILFNYVEEQHIDPTDLAAWEKAIYEVARMGKWLSHPRATVTQAPHKPEESAKPLPSNLAEVSESREIPNSKYLSQKDEQTLWEKAMQLPVDAWETLLTPLPPELSSQDKEKRPYYMRRYAERRSLERLKEQLEPLSSERIAAVAEAVNGVRLK